MSPSMSSTYRRGYEIWPPRQTPGTLYSPLTGAGGGSVADWPTGQSLFLISHPDVKLVNILLSTTRVSLKLFKINLYFVNFVLTTNSYVG